MRVARALRAGCLIALLGATHCSGAHATSHQGPATARAASSVPAGASGAEVGDAPPSDPSTSPSGLGPTLMPPLDEAASAAPARAAITRSVTMRNAPSAAPVVIHVPRAFDPTRPVRLVVFLHGLYSCALQEISSEPVHCRIWYGAGHLGDIQDAADRNSILVGPQFDTGCPPGRFATSNGFRAFVEELLGETLHDVFGGSRTIDQLESVTLVVSSGGFRPASVILARGGLRDRIRVIALLDALYGATGAYLQWLGEAGPERRLFGAHTAGETPARTIAQFVANARRRFGRDVDADPASIEMSLRAHRMVAVASSAAHNVLAQTYLEALLRGSLEP